MGKKKKPPILATGDFETDPFKVDRVPRPFIGEFHSAELTEVFEGDDCATQFVDFLLSIDDPHLIYMHNGGKFDFFFMIDHLEGPMRVINGRIVEAKIGPHTIRDSFAIMPVPLKSYKKDDIDYSKLEREVRHLHMPEIRDYLHSDCVYLYEMCEAFLNRFGPKLTIGGTAMGIIKEMHPFIPSGSDHDKAFRPFYYGGRVECFRSGIIGGGVKLYDVNSMYMGAMKYSRHPINGAFSVSNKMPNSFDYPFFCHFTGWNDGALPAKNPDGSLTFNKEYGEFFACSHELEAAIEFGLIKIEEIHRVYISQDYASFGDYVDMCNDGKAECKRTGDATGYLINKLLGNSGYGRFAINPENFEEWIINKDFGNDRQLIADGYELRSEIDGVELWSKPAEIQESQYCDVAVGASITSAARATLLRGLKGAIDPIYCDTDSIICRAFDGDIDPYRLGAWDLEKTAQYAAIGGKKLYALYDDPNGEPVKISSKGGSLSLSEIIAICEGQRVRYENPAPTFSLKRSETRFVKRNFEKTA